jgi:HTH-type transcriptional regulator/antitoxin HigA
MGACPPAPDHWYFEGQHLTGVDPFRPRWASPPGVTIRDALLDRELSVEEFSEAIDVPLFRLQSLLSGYEPISIELARRIGSSIGGSVQFWLARDGQYRDDLASVAADGWAKTLPISDMADFGWIDRPANWHEQIDAAFQFFGVSNVESWEVSYGRSLQNARFRFSGCERLDPSAVAVWLRRAQIAAETLSLARWDRDALSRRLPDFKALTTERDPKVFVPRLIDLAAEVGVAVSVVRAPHGCKASGAARFLTEDRAQIVLSARYLTDDHLWFTFFHEAGHLLRHDLVATYVDEFQQIADESGSVSLDEQEANDFAADVLLPAEAQRALGSGRPAPRAIVRAAHLSGVSPGIVVGQLQHRGAVGFGSGLNGFKRRYRWNQATLERA